MKKYIYLAGPIAGCDDEDAKGWRDIFTAALAANNPNFIGVSPLRCESPTEPDGTYATTYSRDWANEIAAKNLLDVRSCDLTLVWLPNGDSIGSILEIGWATILHKPVILVSDDDRVLTHPVIMSTVPFRYHYREDGFVKALKTINDLLGVYVP